MTLFKDRPKLLEGIWFCATMLAAAAVAVPIMQLLQWLAPRLYADRLVHDAVILMIVVPLVMYSNRLKNRLKETSLQ